MSEFGSYVVSLSHIEKHPNADKLGIVRLHNPFEAQVIINLNDWAGEDRAVWILPDSIAGDHEVFDWYGRGKRVKTIKLRQLMSYGFFVKALPHHKVGDEVSKDFGVTKYEEPIKQGPASLKGGDSAKGPSRAPTFTDIENVRNTKYSANAFTYGEPVVILEKIDGANARFVYQDGRLHVGTHHRWLKERFADEKKHSYELSKPGLYNIWRRLWHRFGFYKPLEVESQSTWWQMARKYNLSEKLAQHPNFMFVGEMFGNRVNHLKYFEEVGRIELAFYDIYDITTGKYLDWSTCKWIFKSLELPIAPVFYEGPFTSYADLMSHADKGSAVPDAKEIAEGWIIRPENERYNGTVGRVILKYKTDEYLSR